MTEPLIEVEGLKTYFPVTRGIVFKRKVGEVKAVDDVSFDIRHGETLSLVGESGSGKTTIGRTLLRLWTPTAGRILYRGHDLAALDERAIRPLRPKLQMIFQDPYASLNHRQTVGTIVSEAMVFHRIVPPRRSAERTAELLEMVGLEPEAARRYPHEFSGGQRQRIGIARALALEPEFIVCDEAISALDVSIQAQVVNLLQDLQARLGLTYLFIAHDLAVVRHISRRIAVMYLGQIVELAPRTALYTDPRHPYTHSLLSAVPIPDPRIERRRQREPRRTRAQDGSPAATASGCPFAPRCPIATDRCTAERPPLEEVAAEHFVACHYPDEMRTTTAR